MKHKKYIALASSIILLSPFAGGFQAQADTLDELNSEKLHLEEKSQEIQNKINQKEDSLNSLENEKRNLENNVQELQNNIDELLLDLEAQEEALDEIEERIDALQDRIEALEIIIEQRTEKLNNQARVIQTQASLTDVVSIVASAESLTDLVGKVTTVNHLLVANKEIVTQQENDKKEVEDSKQLVEEEKVAAEELKQQIIVSKNNIVAQQNELNHQIALVLENTQLTKAEKKDLEATQTDVLAQAQIIGEDITTEEQRIESERLEKERIAQEKAAAEQAEIAAREQASGNLVASVDSAPTSSTPEVSVGGFINPASGYISSPFGMRLHPIDGTYRLHGGIDFAGSGAIVAAKEGTVEVATFSPSWGYHVVINHGTINGNNVKTLYAHMTPSLSVAPGQSVSQGQQLGIMGTTGESTGVHLHLEVYENGVRIDPLNYFSL
ncbi:peptidoglycan DD-metalloendopeptidase family protein [Jeotgalibaca dankookensis]|uniref:peptidoglycan DD-metalloendopeptidase family protein n=1 Tax=Jeotgalibaca dankookensis TaxID=708126 RepID=UPI0007824DD5|nr:peptidoglycan DD-metalloendopeptidase family protein [Jeotgalibaca dankookensis]